MSSDDEQEEFFERNNFPGKCLRKSKRKQALIEQDSGRPQRHNKRIIRNYAQVICPVCELTLREEDIETHYHQEYDKLAKLLPLKSPKTLSSRGRTSVDPNPQTNLDRETENLDIERRSLNVSDASGSNVLSSTNLMHDVSGPSTRQVPRIKKIKAFQLENEEFKRVKVNRLLRRQCIKWRAKSIQGDETICPVCQEPVPGESPEELQLHANQCLAKQNDDISDDDDNEEDVMGDEYEWCGIKRVRITSLLKSQGQLSALGTMVTKGNEDEDVDVCDLQTEEGGFGPSQYSQDDLDVPSNSCEKICNGLDRSGTESVAENLSHPTEDFIESAENSDVTNQEERQNNSFNASQMAVIDALQMKIRELEDKGNFVCHICHGPYIVPLTSTVCWHVHCEKCWLQALSTQKLCPQCKCIVSPTDLRKIYL